MHRLGPRHPDHIILAFSPPTGDSSVSASSRMPARNSNGRSARRSGSAVRGGGGCGRQGRCGIPRFFGSLENVLVVSAERYHLLPMVGVAADHLRRPVRALRPATLTSACGRVRPKPQPFVGLGLPATDPDRRGHRSGRPRRLALGHPRRQPVCGLLGRQLRTALSSSASRCRRSSDRAQAQQRRQPSSCCGLAPSGAGLPSPRPVPAATHGACVAHSRHNPPPPSRGMRVPGGNQQLHGLCDGRSTRAIRPAAGLPGISSLAALVREGSHQLFEVVVAPDGRLHHMDDHVAQVPQHHSRRPRLPPRTSPPLPDLVWTFARQSLHLPVWNRRRQPDVRSNGEVSGWC